MTIKNFTILIFLVAVISGCQYLKPTIKADVNTVSYQQLLAQHKSWQQAIKSLSGTYRMTLDSPQYSGSFNADIMAHGQDSMLATVTGPFGMHVGKVFISNKRFVYYNQIMNHFMKGNRADFAGRNFLQFPLEIDQLKDVFLARDPFDILKKETYRVDENRYFLEAENGLNRYKIWFNAANNLIEKIEYWSDDVLLFYKEYRNYRTINGVLFPFQINFVRPDSKQGLSIIILDLKLNTPVDRAGYKIEVADDAKQIDLSEQPLN